MSKRKQERDELDTETTIANMNVEGFRWYRPEGARAGEKREPLPPLSGREKRAMLRGAIRAALPILVGVLAVVAALVGLAYLWLG